MGGSDLGFQNDALGGHLQEIEFEALTVNQQGEVIQRQPHRARQFLEDPGNGVVLEMVAVVARTFWMGSRAVARDMLMSIPSIAW